METIKLSTKNFWFRYWNFISFSPSSWKRPKDTCSLRKELIWKTLFMLITLPVSLPALIISLISFDIREGLAEAGNALLFAFTGIGTFLGVVSGASLSTAYMFFPIIFAILIIVDFGLVALIGSVTMCYIDKYKELHSKEKKKPGIIKTLYNGWKDKLCSKIEYID